MNAYPPFYTDVLFHNVDDYMLWAFAAQNDDYPADAAKLDGPKLQLLMSKMLKNWHPDLRRAVLESDPSSVSLLPLQTSLPVRPWETTNVTLLLGDSIHSMTPLAGMGANTALRDSQLLSRVLIAISRKEASLLPALSSYETQMLKYGFEAVRTSLQNTQRAVSHNRFGRLTGRAFLKLSGAFPSRQRKELGTAS